jgi:hypothetical protein
VRFRSFGTNRPGIYFFFSFSVACCLVSANVPRPTLPFPLQNQFLNFGLTATPATFRRCNEKKFPVSQRKLIVEVVGRLFSNF